MPRVGCTHRLAKAANTRVTRVGSHQPVDWHAGISEWLGKPFVLYCHVASRLNCAAFLESVPSIDVGLQLTLRDVLESEGMSDDEVDCVLRAYEYVELTNTTCSSLLGTMNDHADRLHSWELDEAYGNMTAALRKINHMPVKSIGYLMPIEAFSAWSQKEPGTSWKPTPIE